ncbi:MAG TPA: glycosyltransferase [Vicinamibacterales bacterium]|nr:glycosyltransferase [Vicinamibacterales bacterium]
MNSSPQVPVAVFLTSFDAGGTERQMSELIRRLDRNRFTVHAVCFRRKGQWLARVEESAASVVEFPVRGFARSSTLRQLWRFADWCRRERIAIVQTSDFYSNVFGLTGALLGGVKVRIGSRRELNPDKSAAQIRLQRLAYGAATRIVANSPAAAAMLASEGVRKKRVSIVPNGLDANLYLEPRRGGSIRRVITVANLRPEKSHETLIAAAALLSSSCPDLRYVIVGDGSRRAELEALARVRGVDRIVEFLGHREDVPELLAGADAFVLPSRSEAFPNGVIEAMAAGLPVIASAVGGILDLVEPGRTGALVPPADAEALASAIRSLHADPARAQAIGAAARCEVLARYSFDRMLRMFETLYETELQAQHLVRAQAAQAGI